MAMDRIAALFLALGGLVYCISYSEYLWSNKLRLAALGALLPALGALAAAAWLCFFAKYI